MSASAAHLSEVVSLLRSVESCESAPLLRAAVRDALRLLGASATHSPAEEDAAAVLRAAVHESLRLLGGGGGASAAAPGDAPADVAESACRAGSGCHAEACRERHVPTSAQAAEKTAGGVFGWCTIHGVWHAVCGGVFGWVRGGWVVCTDGADFGRTVLHKAVGRGAVAVVAVLAAAGAEVSHVVNLVDADCETPLFAAVARGDAAAAALLLRAGADVNLSNKRDVTPLMHAARHCDAACARALLAAGADASLRADGRTARDQVGQHCLDERPCDSYEATAALLAGHS